MKALHIVIASALITGAAIKAAPALAQTHSVNGAIAVSVVRTADLDLGTDAGRRLLDRRLAAAAREVCGAASDVDIEGKNAVRQCRDDVLAQARSDRDAILVAARGGTTIAITAAR